MFFVGGYVGGWLISHRKDPHTRSDSKKRESALGNQWRIPFSWFLLETILVCFQRRVVFYKWKRGKKRQTTRRFWKVCSLLYEKQLKLQKLLEQLDVQSRPDGRPRRQNLYEADGLLYEGPQAHFICFCCKSHTHISKSRESRVWHLALENALEAPGEHIMKTSYTIGIQPPNNATWLSTIQASALTSHREKGKKQKCFLGGGFKYFLFSPLLGEMIQVD